MTASHTVTTCSPVPRLLPLCSRQEAAHRSGGDPLQVADVDRGRSLLVPCGGDGANYVLSSNVNARDVGHTRTKLLTRTELQLLQFIGQLPFLPTAIATRLAGVPSRATGYRTLQALTQAGLVGAIRASLWPYCGDPPS